MKISSINTNAFKGILILPKSNYKKGEDKDIILETKDIVEINTRNRNGVKIQYIDNNNNLKEETIQNKKQDPNILKNMILFAYAGASANDDVIIKI